MPDVLTLLEYPEADNGGSGIHDHGHPRCCVIRAIRPLQRRAPAGKLGRVSGVISTAESTTESVSMPAAGALVAVAGLRPGAFVLAAVAVAAGAACLLE
jgi:hypothetical protein